MSDWRDVALDDVTTKIGSGATPRGGKDAYRDEGIALIRSMNVLDEGFQFDGLARISAEQAARLKHVAVEAGDVLVNITGASVARCCVAPRSVLPARVNQHVAIIRLRRDQAIPRFVSAYLTTAEGKGRLLSLASGGATREALTKAMLEQFTIRLPDMATQQRTAAVLEAIDELIENNRRRVDVLEEMARAIYREWFVRFRYPGHEAVPLVDSPLGPIPAGWAAIQWGDVAELDYGRALRGYKDSTGEFPVFGTNGQIGWHEASLFPPGVVVGRKGAYRGIHYSAKPCWVIDTAFYLRILDTTRVDPLYAFHQLRSVDLDSIDSGSAIPSTSRPAFYAIPLVVPGPEVMRRFADVAGVALAEHRALARTSQALAALRDLLLPRLVTGQIDVSRLDLEALTEAATA